MSLQCCSQQPQKEPSAEESHVLSEPLLNFKKAMGRQEAATVLRDNPALSQVKTALPGPSPS